jgi:phospholipid/cholesterol/gamma-HCH transport system substrate-binding protein
LKITKEIKIAVLVLITLFIVFYGYYYLRGFDLFGQQKKYYAVYPTVDGLVVSSMVQVSGFTVGKVTNISFHPHRNGELLVEMLIDNKDVVVTKGSIAKIGALDLLGSKGILLEIKSGAGALPIGDTLESAMQRSLKDEVNMQVLPLKNKVESLLAQFDSTFQAIQGIFDKNMRNNLSVRLNNTFVSLENIAHVTDVMMMANAKTITNTMGNLESVSGNLKHNNDQLTKIINNTASITDTLSKIKIGSTFKRVDSIITDMAAIMEKINKGEGSAGKLLNDEKLYANLEQATLELDKLLEDMRVNPKRYVHFSMFSRKEKDDEKPQKKDRKN